MNKTLFSILIVLFQANMLFGQVSEVDKCGLEDNAHLNSYEAKYFNEVFKDRKGEFDFSRKVIAFFTGSSGTTMSVKSNYFKSLKNSNNSDKDVHAWQAHGTQLLILSSEEKNLSGGYDAILVSRSKLLKQGKSRTKLVKRLKN
ncbi:hypothetical protein [Marinigracilibium pacificum]|uniref:DUF8192 domain-containing protein n=1 Tax=Marinigracilibium pacificum TaxID=2729599 RepID=A0A848J712_9BACT|nr:hypothetical protein [Marinigracilibium pacificum]NMM48902.1 hypothetical protein [Marinigracilibium pacificum]